MGNEYIEEAVSTAPADTWGCLVAPWNPSEVYGVAAKWSEASSPVYEFGRDGWKKGVSRASDFNSPRTATVAIVLAAMKERGEAGDESELNDRAFNLCANVTEF